MAVFVTDPELRMADETQDSLPMPCPIRLPRKVATRSGTKDGSDHTIARQAFQEDAFAKRIRAETTGPERIPTYRFG
jgi:hypothetical protein